MKLPDALSFLISSPPACSTVASSTNTNFGFRRFSDPSFCRSRVNVALSTTLRTQPSGRRPRCGDRNTGRKGLPGVYLFDCELIAVCSTSTHSWKLWSSNLSASSMTNHCSCCRVKPFVDLMCSTSLPGVQIRMSTFDVYSGT